MVGGIESNVVDGPISWRAPSADLRGRKKTDHFGSARFVEVLVQGRPNKTMSVYGAGFRIPNHTEKRENKTAGRRAVILQKTRVWTGFLGLAP